MKRILYLIVATLLMVTFMGGCSAEGESPKETTEAEKTTVQEQTEKQTTEKITEKITEKETEPESITDENGNVVTTLAPKAKLDRTPVNCDHIDPSKPMIALTFDDGPSANTGRLLNILERNGARATFFVVGKYIKGNEALLQKMVANGNELASHTWSHANLSTSSDEVIISQLADTRAAIKKATGVDAPLARPPYGAHNENVKNIAASQGISLIMWSLDTRDWESRNATAVYSKTMSNVRNGDIILCHDLHKTTVDAMESVIPSLIQSGYQLVTVSELLTYGREELTCGEVYFRR